MAFSNQLQPQNWLQPTSPAASTAQTEVFVLAVAVLAPAVEVLTVVVFVEEVEVVLLSVVFVLFPQLQKLSSLLQSQSAF